MNRNNYCVIMGGGIGSRFWPASREDKPKQFLDFFGTGKPLLRLTFDRLKNIVPTENIFIVTNDRYKAMTQEVLPEMREEQILTEPMRRNTAPCIALATYHIHAINPNANIVVAPSDHLILDEIEFTRIITDSLNFANNHAMLLTLGILPNRPETGYGYIQMSDNTLDNMTKVKVFTEKPSFELAKVFYESGEFLWNSGIFIWNVKTIMEALRTYLPEVSNVFDKGIDKFGTPDEKAFIDEVYAYCPNISIDYGVMEKASNVYVKAADFGWSDLGTWSALYEISDKDDMGNVTVGAETLLYDSTDNIINLPKGKLAVVQGLNDYIVVESDGVLLICRRDEEQRIREFVTEAKMRFDDKFI